MDCRRILLDLCEAEAADRKERRRERLLKESGLPGGKTLATLDEEQLPPEIHRQWPALLDGSFVERAENVLAFGLPGRGKAHFLAVLGRDLVLRHEYPGYFTPTFKLVQQLLAAKAALKLSSLIQRLDRYRVVILNDLGYVQQIREEMEVLFTFLAERYERRSVMISSNLVFSKWDQIFKDPPHHHGRGRPPRASRPYPGVRQPEHPRHPGQETRQGVSPPRPPPWVVPLRKLCLRLSFLRSTTQGDIPTQSSPHPQWGILIVAKAEE